MTDTKETTKAGRTLIVCFDGTTNEYDADNTNVVKLLGLIKKEKHDQQLCYYQPGIGTWFNPGVVSPFFLWGAKILDEAFAWYLDAHVIEGYNFVMQNYEVGDKICIFEVPIQRGMHPGAPVLVYKALAGMLYKVGLLPRDNEQQIPFAYKLYKRTDKDGIALSAGYKQTFCRDVKIEFVGVWDTVASVGLVMGRSLPFTDSNKAIKTFRHALSLDECRVKFKPNLYHRAAPTPAAAAKDPQKASASSNHEALIASTNPPGLLSRLFKPRKKTVLVSESAVKINKDDDGPDTDMLEVWFSGCHSDVGGGAVPDSEAHSLAYITLRWMVHEIQKANCGITFSQTALDRASIPSYVSTPDGGQLSPPDVEEMLNNADALQPLDDELKKNVLWWLLEVIPLSYTYQDAKGVWHTSWSINFGRGRLIPTPNPNFHVTVKKRMEDSKLKYKPKAYWQRGTERYIE